MLESITESRHKPRYTNKGGSRHETGVSVKIPKILGTRKMCCNHLKIWTFSFYHWVMHPKDVDEIANSVDQEQTALILVYTVCLDMPVQKLMITVTCLSNQRCWLHTRLLQSFTRDFTLKSYHLFVCDLIFVPHHQKTCFSHMRTTKVHSHSLISTFVVRYLASIISILAKSKISRL